MIPVKDKRCSLQVSKVGLIPRSPNGCDNFRAFQRALLWCSEKSEVQLHKIWIEMQNSPIQSLQTHARHSCKGSHCPLQAWTHPSHQRIPSVVSRSKWLRRGSAMWRHPCSDSKWFQRRTNHRFAQEHGGHGQSQRNQKYHRQTPLCWGGDSWKRGTNFGPVSKSTVSEGHYLTDAAMARMRVRRIFILVNSEVIALEGTLFSEWCSEAKSCFYMLWHSRHY